MKCDACSLILCKDHLQYDTHSCAGLYKKNIQVPVCPLCSQPIPVSRGSVPDHAVSQHIENNCETRKKAKVFSNKCNKAKCKKKELVPCICDGCKLNFCLTHRHPADHSCEGPQAARGRAAAAASARATPQTSSASSGQSKISDFFSGPFRQAAPSSGGGQSRGQMSASAAAALNRQQGRGTTPGRPLVARTANAGMSEDEALAAALAASLGTGGSHEAGGQGPRSASEEEEDRMLALALAESERMAGGQSQRPGTTTGGDKSCTMQ